MNKNFVEYFQDLNRTKLPRKSGRIFCDNKTIVYDGHYAKRPKIEIYSIGKKHYFGKEWITDVSPASVVAHEMYNSVGVDTPPAYILDIGKGNASNHLRFITPDITEIPDLTCTQPSNHTYLKYSPEFMNAPNKWDILYNEPFRQKLLSFMTRDCLNQLIKMFLVDELRTELDRHWGNYFFVKKSNEEKFSSIIAIDFDATAIMRYMPKNKAQFEHFLLSLNGSITPTGRVIASTYISKIRELKEIIGEGALTLDQCQALKQALEFDYASEVKHFCMNHRLFKEAKTAPEPIARLWDYNRKELSQELGL